MAAGSQSMKILLVEDSQQIAARLQELLEMDAGVRVVRIVADQKSAIAAAREFAYDAMILDLELASGSGFGVLEVLGDKQPPTIVMTNHAHPQYRRRALALGACHFLDKAVEFEKVPELLAAMRAGG